MAVYKVPQDVEAEDKFLGPLSFRQFLFAGGAVICGYLIFLTVTSGVAWLSFIFLPFFLGFLALAFPWSKDQPTELFLASRIRFLLVPRRRIWDQTGVKDLVKITVPKKEVHVYTDGLDQDQVKSRLSALSTMVDSRGWAVKNMDHAPSSDRLVQATQQPQSVEAADSQKAEDILDQTSSQSSNIDTALKQSEDEHRKHTLDLVAQAREKSKHMNKSVLNDDEPGKTNNGGAEQPVAEANPILDSVSLPKVDDSLQKMKAATPSSPAVTRPDVSNDEEQALLDKIHKKQATEQSISQHSHLKTIQPTSGQPVQNNSTVPADDGNDSQTSSTPVDPAILALAQNGDRSVESLAREANKDSDDEVVISLR